MLQVFNYKFKHDIFSHAAIIKTNHIFSWITSINRSNCHIFSLQWETTQTITMTMPYHNTTANFLLSFTNPFMVTKFQPVEKIIWYTKPEALKSLYRSPGNKKKQLVLCKNYVLQW